MAIDLLPSSGLAACRIGCTRLGRNMPLLRSLKMGWWATRCYRHVAPAGAWKTRGNGDSATAIRIALRPQRKILNDRNRGSARPLARRVNDREGEALLLAPRPRY